MSESPALRSAVGKLERWKDTGTKRDFWVAGTAPLGTPTAKSVTPPAPPLDLGTPEVGTYVIETSELRLELEDTASIGSFGSFDASVRTRPGRAEYAIETFRENQAALSFRAFIWCRGRRIVLLSAPSLTPNSTRTTDIRLQVLKEVRLSGKLVFPKTIVRHG